MKNILVFLSYLLLASCASRIKPAPIIDATSTINHFYQQKEILKIPQKTENKEPILGSLNDSNNKIKIVTNIPNQKTVNVLPPTIKQEQASATWTVPIKAKNFTPFTTEKKGMDFINLNNQPVFAIASGKTVYSGNGLKGYGNLIIIKHADNYLSAYAQNKQNLVKEGDIVKKGQIIANTTNKLHFELRKNGKPINPIEVIKQINATTN